MTFPTIKHLNDLVPFVEANPQFRIQKQPNGFTVVCYMLQDEDTFTGENEDYARECRGITFHPDGTIASRTLHKFQNVGESDATQPENIPWDQITRVMDKRDGSMITFVRTSIDLSHRLGNGMHVVIGKTKKTFTSDEATAATHYMTQVDGAYEWLNRILWAGFTPTFEWTSPRFPIVLTYKEDALTLLQIRDNQSGRYLMPDTDGLWELLTCNCPFPIVENIIGAFTTKWVPEFKSTMGEDSFLPKSIPIAYEQFREAQIATEGVEGWIIQAKNGEMWKVKTKWYCDLHHSVTFTRWRDVARTVLEDKSDDLKAAFAMTGRSIDPILKVEREVKRVIDNAKYDVGEVVAEGRRENLTAKDMAMKHNGDRLFGLIMKMFRGQEINWFDWYLKNYIDTWNLQVIVQGNEDVEQQV